MGSGDPRDKDAEKVYIEKVYKYAWSPDPWVRKKLDEKLKQIKSSH